MTLNEAIQRLRTVTDTTGHCSVLLLTVMIYPSGKTDFRWEGQYHGNTGQFDAPSLAAAVQAIEHAAMLPIVETDMLNEDLANLEATDHA